MIKKTTIDNTKEYWEHRFSSGDWEGKEGFKQTRNHAITQVPHMNICSSFKGTIIDFGCGAGDAFPVYRQTWQHARLIGVDISPSAIQLCKDKFNDIATFICGDIDVLKYADVIICSHILEHLDDDYEIVKELLRKCDKLIIIVPFREFPLYCEHVRSYDRDYFQEFKVKRIKIFHKEPFSWSRFIKNAKISVKNIIRHMKRENIHSRRLQILYEIHQK
jgi:SAM-dependent methyltransferase